MAKKKDETVAIKCTLDMSAVREVFAAFDARLKALEERESQRGQYAEVLKQINDGIQQMSDLISPTLAE